MVIFLIVNLLMALAVLSLLIGLSAIEKRREEKTNQKNNSAKEATYPSAGSAKLQN